MRILLYCLFLVTKNIIIENNLNKDSEAKPDVLYNADSNEPREDSKIETVIEYVTTSIVTPDITKTHNREINRTSENEMPNKVPESVIVNNENGFKDRFDPDKEKDYGKKVVYEVTKNLDKNNINSVKKCYIVTTVFDFSSILELVKSFQGDVKYIYREHINGFSFCLENISYINKIRGLPGITSLEEDIIYKQAGTQTSISKYMWLISNYKNYVFNNYLLDNILFRLLGIDKLLRFLFGYYEYKYTGKNTRVYLIDSSIEQNTMNSLNLSQKKTSCNDHGNYMKELLLNPKYGYSKDTELIVLDGVACNGEINLSTILKLLEVVKKGTKPTVLLFGVYGPFSTILNGVIEILYNKGIIVISPAGNNHDNACNYSPGSSRSSITVGSLNKHANISSFSNHGGCTRLYSLGENVYDGKRVKGSSFSAANVASAILMYLERSPNADFNEIWQFLDKNSSWQLFGSYLSFNIPIYQLDYKSEKNGVSGYNERYGDSSLQYFIYIILLICIIILAVYLYKRIYKHNRREERREYIIPPNSRYD